jgi:hypothetical protein
VLAGCDIFQSRNNVIPIEAKCFVHGHQ